jgi:hypothetical protein
MVANRLPPPGQRPGKKLIICPLVSQCGPDQLEAPFASWSVGTCSRCGQPVWVNAPGRTALATGTVEPACLPCIRKLYPRKTVSKVSGTEVGRVRQEKLRKLEEN